MFGIAAKDLLLFGLIQPQLVDHAGKAGDRIEGRVTGEQGVFDTEEIEPAFGPA
jgi:hypothetical protein